jgi:hypothetical protein
MIVWEHLPLSHGLGCCWGLDPHRDIGSQRVAVDLTTREHIGCPALVVGRPIVTFVDGSPLGSGCSQTWFVDHELTVVKDNRSGLDAGAFIERLIVEAVLVWLIGWSFSDRSSPPYARSLRR